LRVLWGGTENKNVMTQNFEKTRETFEIEYLIVVVVMVL